MVRLCLNSGKDILVLNIVKKFDKALIKIAGLRDHTSKKLQFFINNGQ